ncbi:MAG TPA: carboxypeptidase-like regulatory domain-containing protein [Bryobacteraceae bacterium]|nr:carboxypeptidase-like regulatory domain-containing protein [Bryobacteraceae bacterium]
MIRFLPSVAILSLVLPCASLSQTPPTASLSGHILAEDGRTLRAAVTLSFAGPRGFPSPPRRVFTGTNGAFTFSKLPAAKYVLCAQVSAAEPAPANSPWVDTCVWGSPQAPITLAAGQQLAGIVFTAPKGAWLQVRVVDPEHVLPQVAAKGPALLEPQLQLVLQGPDKLLRHARFVSADGAGRNYQVAIPLKTALNLQVASSVADVFDQNGKAIKATDQAPFQPNTPGELAPLTFTIHKKTP